jgi:hypothetical protein
MRLNIMATTTPIAVPKAITADIFGHTLTLTFSNGQTLELNAMLLAPHIRDNAVLHGLKQKLVDAAAFSRDPETGKSATIADKYNAVKEVFDRITSPEGTWNKVREVGATATGGLLARALMQMTGKTKEAITDFLDSKTKEEISALKKNPKVAAVIAELQMESIDVDTDSLLAELTDSSNDISDGE